jgi:hypothetical protein
LKSWGDFAFRTLARRIDRSMYLSFLTPVITAWLAFWILSQAVIRLQAAIAVISGAVTLEAAKPGPIWAAKPP